MSKEKQEMVVRNEGLINGVLSEFNHVMRMYPSEADEFVSIAQQKLVEGVLNYGNHVRVSEQTYLSKAIRNGCYDQMRKIMIRKERIELYGDKMDRIIEEGSSIEDKYIADEGEERIYQIARESGIKDLEAQLRLIAKGYSVSEIETTLGIRQSTQWRRLRKFKKILEKTHDF
jgi:DNA-directed RNA polymerase specialized sigma subunit